VQLPEWIWLWKLVTLGEEKAGGDRWWMLGRDGLKWLLKGFASKPGMILVFLLYAAGRGGDTTPRIVKMTTLKSAGEPKGFFCLCNLCVHRH
jgi:hypothetical protein